MSRIVTVGAAQTGPVQRNDTRADVVERLIALLRQGADAGCDLVVFPELVLTTFFPRWWVDDRAGFDHFFETGMPGPDTQPLFDEATRLGVGFHLGYAELTPGGQHFNTAIVVDRHGTIIGKYRKVHLPGHHDHQPWREFQHLERYYFDPGDGFGVFAGFGGVLGMAICNDRRWSETYRVLGLQGCEVAMIGYNTPIHYAPDPSQNELQGFHNRLCLQSGAYQNGMWVVGVAKAGEEEGCDLLGESAIYAPSGEVRAACSTVGDELAVAECDLDLCADYKDTLFDFGYYRRPEVYGPITAQQGVIVPPDVAASLEDSGGEGT